MFIKNEMLPWRRLVHSEEMLITRSDDDYFGPTRISIDYSSLFFVTTYLYQALFEAKNARAEAHATLRPAF